MAVKKTRRAAAKKNVVTLAQKDRAMLLALDASFDTLPDVSVPVLMQEAAELTGVVGKHQKRLVGGTRLEKKLATCLPGRRAILDAAESQWRTRRLQAAGPKDLHDEGETFKRDAVAALRYFAAEDATVQKRVDAIQEGTGLADFVDDLRRLGELVSEQRVALKKADLPKNAAARAKELAESLSEGAVAESTDDVAADLLSVRNRAFWNLRGAMDEIRAAGRYAFRAEPKILGLFRGTRTPVRAKAAKPAPSTPPAA